MKKDKIDEIREIGKEKKSKMSKEDKKIAGILAGSLGVFGATTLVLSWPIWIGGILSVGTYIGLSLFTAEPPKIGDTPVEYLSGGLTLKENLDDASYKILKIEEIGRQVRDPEIHEMSLKLANIGFQIIDFLEKNPKRIASALTFLRTDVDTALRILDNYRTLYQNVSSDKMIEVEENTEKSLEILLIQFENQMNSFFKEKILDLDADTKVLSKTLKIGDIRKEEENIQTETDKVYGKENNIEDIINDL